MWLLTRNGGRAGGPQFGPSSPAAAAGGPTPALAVEPWFPYNRISWYTLFMSMCVCVCSWECVR